MATKNTGKSYFAHYLNILDSNPDATIADVAAHFGVKAPSVKSSMVNYLATTGQATALTNGGVQYMDLLDRMGRQPAARVDTTVAIPDSLRADILAGTTLSKLYDRYAGEGKLTKVQVRDVFLAERKFDYSGKAPRAAYEAWVQDVSEDGEKLSVANPQKFWSELADKIDSSRGPSYLNTVAVGFAKRNKLTEPPTIAPRLKKLILTDEQTAMLGKYPDSELAVLWNAGEATVAKKRRDLGIKLIDQPTDTIDGKLAYDAVIEHKTYQRAALLGSQQVSIPRLKHAVTAYCEKNGLAVPAGGRGRQ